MLFMFNAKYNLVNSVKKKTLKKTLKIAALKLINLVLSITNLLTFH